MKDNCNCRCCKNNVDEFICIECYYNFNECEVVWEFTETLGGNLPTSPINLCPRCSNADSIPFNLKGKIRRKT